MLKETFEAITVIGLLFALVIIFLFTEKCEKTGMEEIRSIHVWTFVDVDEHFLIDGMYGERNEESTEICCEEDA